MESNRSKMVRGVGITAFWTLISRLLGMVRDVVTAALFGLATGGVMDAFVIAFRVPNIFRRLFGEGALSASVLPVIAEKLEHDRFSAWQLVSTLLGCVFILMATLTLLAEMVCGLVWSFGPGEEIRLIAGLSAVMLPYLLFITLASVVSAALHALHHFGATAFVPIIFNLLWIGVAVGLVPRWRETPDMGIYWIAAAVLCGGLLQLGLQWAVLRSLGFRWHWNWKVCRNSLGKIGRHLVPMAFGLAILPLNVLVDTAVAWMFSAPAATPISWLGGGISYPLQDGAVAAIYFAERLVQFPVGLLGVVIGIVVFPTLSRQATRGEMQQLGVGLTEAVRGNLFLAIPATAGLIWLAEPLTSLLYRHGSFTVTDALRTSQMVAAYATGIWAYSVLPVIARGFYATGNSRFPFRLGVGVVLLNGLLDCLLIWQWGENSLAFSSAGTVALFILLLGRKANNKWGFATGNLTVNRKGTKNLLWMTILRSCLASGVMIAGGQMILSQLPATTSSASFALELARIFVLMGCCVVLYLVISVLLGERIRRQAEP